MMPHKFNSGVKASVFLALRNELLVALREVDVEIDHALGFRASKRAASKARELFAERQRIADELAELGVDVAPHSSVQR